MVNYSILLRGAIQMIKIKSKKGFTLIELLVVIAILTVLAFVTVPVVNDVIEKARISNDVQDIRAMEMALNLCAVDGRSYLSATYDMPRFEAVLRETSGGDTQYETLTNNRCNETFNKDFFPLTAQGFSATVYNYCTVKNKKLTIPSQYGYDYYYNVDTNLIIKAEKGISSRDTLKEILKNTRDEDDLTGMWINITQSSEMGLTNEIPEPNSVLYTSHNGG